MLNHDDVDHGGSERFRAVQSGSRQFTTVQKAVLDGISRCEIVGIGGDGAPTGIYFRRTVVEFMLCGTLIAWRRKPRICFRINGHSFHLDTNFSA